MNKKKLGFKLIFTFVLILSACQHAIFQPYFSPIRALAQNSFIEIPLEFPQRLYLKQSNSMLSDESSKDETLYKKLLYIFIEGDGAPWFQSQYPPNNPTPKTSTVAQLAIAHKSDSVAYLGRACQYITEASPKNCPEEWWTDKRFSIQVISMSQIAIDSAMFKSGANEIALIGYSGGGVLATLIAAQRKDVRCIVTLGSPLDTRAWTEMKGLRPLTGSLNPSDFAEKLSLVPQSHYIGSDDKVVPIGSLGQYKLTPLLQSHTILKGIGHTTGWLEQFEKIKKQSCLSKLG